MLLRRVQRDGFATTKKEENSRSYTALTYEPPCISTKSYSLKVFNAFQKRTEEDCSLQSSVLAHNSKSKYR